MQADQAGASIREVAELRRHADIRITIRQPAAAGSRSSREIQFPATGFMLRHALRLVLGFSVSNPRPGWLTQINTSAPEDGKMGFVRTRFDRVWDSLNELDSGTDAYGKGPTELLHLDTLMLAMAQDRMQVFSVRACKYHEFIEA